MAKTPRRADQSRPAPRDPYQEITDRIVAALEAGTLPWRKPWDPAKAGIDARPRNATTGRVYNGINVLLLALSPFAWSTGDHRWCSYRQATERGWQVRKGERGTTIFFFRRIEVDTGASAAGEGDDEVRRIPMLRAYTVFHALQIDGIPAFVRPETPEPNWQPPEAVALIAKNSGVQIRTGGPKAFYAPNSDHIQMPPHGAFASDAEWAATLLHEMAHWSGAEDRLNRDLTGGFGSAPYAEEELRAELASVFLGNTLGLPSDIPNHASYLAHWLAKLRADKREIFRAAASAQRIADYLLAFHPEFSIERPDEGPDAEVAAQSVAA